MLLMVRTHNMGWDGMNYLSTDLNGRIAWVSWGNGTLGVGVSGSLNDTLERSLEIKLTSTPKCEEKICPILHTGYLHPIHASNFGTYLSLPSRRKSPISTNTLPVIPPNAQAQPASLSPKHPSSP